MGAARVLQGPWGEPGAAGADAEAPAENAGEHAQRLRRQAFELLQQAHEVVELYIETERDIQETLEALSEEGS